MTQETKTKIVTEMEKRFDSKVTENSFETVGPSIGSEVTQAASIAVVVAALLISCISGLPSQHPSLIPFGTAAIIAMLHDVAVVVGSKQSCAKFSAGRSIPSS